MLYAAYAMHDLVHHAHVGLVTPLLQGLEPQLLQPLLLDVAGQAGHHAHSLLLNFLQHIFVSFRPRGPGWCAKLEVGPHILYIQPYKKVPIPTRCVLSVSQAEIQSQTLPLMPWACMHLPQLPLYGYFIKCFGKIQKYQVHRFSFICCSCCLFQEF